MNDEEVVRLDIGATRKELYSAVVIVALAFKYLLEVCG